MFYYMLHRACLMFMLVCLLVAQDVPPLLVDGPPSLDQVPPVTVGPTHPTHRSIETLVVILAVIAILGVVAGIFARVCGGRHLAGSGDHDIEGWVERKCATCIDGGDPRPQEVEESKK